MIVAIIFLVFKYLINIMMPIFLAFIFAAVVRPISRALSRETRYVRGKDGNNVLVKRKFHMTAMWPASSACLCCSSSSAAF